MKLFYLIILIYLTILNAIRLKKSNTKKSKDHLSELSDEELDKLMNDYGLNTSDLTKNNKEKKDNHINMLDNKKPSSIADVIKNNKDSLRKFQLTPKNAIDLLDILKDYKLFSRLPVSAQNIVATSINNKSYMNKSHKNQTDQTMILISNTINSQAVLDHDNKVGRKGMLTLIDKDNSDIIQSWAVLNNKVFCFYSSSNYLHIIKIYRVAMVEIKDFIFNPCFMLFYKDSEDSKSLVCAVNIREKDYWITSFKYHKEQYYNK